jgi:hypothetical protein
MILRQAVFKRARQCDPAAVSGKPSKHSVSISARDV